MQCHAQSCSRAGERERAKAVARCTLGRILRVAPQSRAMFLYRVVAAQRSSPAHSDCACAGVALGPSLLQLKCIGASACANMGWGVRSRVVASHSVCLSVYLCISCCCFVWWFKPLTEVNAQLNRRHNHRNTTLWFRSRQLLSVLEGKRANQ